MLHVVWWVENKISKTHINVDVERNFKVRKIFACQILHHRILD